MRCVVGKLRSRSTTSFPGGCALLSSHVTVLADLAACSWASVLYQGNIHKCVNCFLHLIRREVHKEMKKRGLSAEELQVGDPCILSCECLATFTMHCLQVPATVGVWHRGTRCTVQVSCCMRVVCMGACPWREQTVLLALRTCPGWCHGVPVVSQRHPPQLLQQGAGTQLQHSGGTDAGMLYETVNVTSM